MSVNAAPSIPFRFNPKKFKIPWHLPCQGRRVYSLHTIDEAIQLFANWPELSRPLVIGAGSNLVLPAVLERPCVQLSDAGNYPGAG